MVEKMKTLFRTMVLGSLLALSANSYALSESEAEDMADLTAVFVFLKRLWLPEPAQHADPSRAGVLCPTEPVGPEQL